MQRKAEIHFVQSSCWNSKFSVPVFVVAEEGEDVLRLHVISNVAQEVLSILKTVQKERQLHMRCSRLFLPSESEFMQSVCHVSESMVTVLCEPIKKDQTIEQLFLERKEHEDVGIW